MTLRMLLRTRCLVRRVAATFLLSASVNCPAIPAPPVLISPASNTVNIGTSPALKVKVSEPGDAILKATFYGRTAPANPGRDFTIAVLPDTQ